MSESRIKILPEEIINKIAAGEVVERPASVVKELVENSIDAGATIIAIEVQKSGKKLIRVSDNGCGMSPEEINLALQRHSTSKIKSIDDLFNIQTLGFRGEALPSIASVSKLKIEPNPSGCGLTVEVKDLFYNVPARKKFLKSDATELGHIGEIISKYVISFPQISFKFISDGKPLLMSTGSGKLIEAIVAVYGTELAKELMEINYQFPNGNIYGFISRPTISRIDRSYETFYVNQRYVRNFLLNRALEDAYRNLIPNQRYPVGIIFIEIDPKKVDINVHPTKREVKFANNQEIMEALTTAVKGNLSHLTEKQIVRFSEKIERTMKTWQPEMTSPFFSAAPLETQINIIPEPSLSPIYQLKQTYIIATDHEELVLIDQHAAAERIIYDQLSEQNHANHKQFLLVPETIELNPSEGIILKNHLPYLHALGFEIEEFGVNSFIVRALPTFFTKINTKQLIIDLIGELYEIGKSAQIEVVQEKIKKVIACHSAIKAGEKLSSAQMLQLIKDLFATKNPSTCPHGRPTMIRLTEKDLAKKFKR
ncbi:MAG: DNA mismatch repair endonuclease MutL [Candidatus Margulisiibacteriota bacterium]